MKKHIVSVLLLGAFFAAGLTIASCNEESPSSSSAPTLQMGAGGSHSCPEGYIWNTYYKECAPICPPGYCAFKVFSWPGIITWECRPANANGKCYSKQGGGGCAGC